MKFNLSFKIILLFFLGFIWKVSAKENVEIYNLLERVVPKHAQQFQIEITPSNGKDHFEILGKDNRVVLKGNNQIAIASALNWYLKYFCHAQMGWNGSQVQLPDNLPIPVGPVTKTVEPDWRVYMNYCTLNYSAAWWDWERWEKEIDFMAMNGINMPLSVVGLEGVWYHALLRVGYTDEEARDFLVGPAYLAWQWMTNIESANGPLPKSWIDKHIQLGKRIIERQVSLGMQPIQQGFSGYVPRKFIEKFPEAKIAYGSGWCSFDATAQLDPLDSLFKQFGQIFLEEQQRLFGSYGYYAADPFHEGTPPQKDKPYLHAVGKAIHELLTGFDSDAHIVMQAWSIREDIVKAIPKDRVLILDLAGSKYKEKGKEGFWGYNFVVGNLHNFGGRINLHGDVRLLASNQFAIAKSIYPHAVGAGLFMEAIEQNPLYYDLAFEMPFHQHEIDPKPWIKNYLMRRYGKEVDAMDYMAELLLDGPYKQGTNGTENSSIIAARPALEVKKSGPNAGFSIPYDAKSLVRLWKLLLKERSLQKSDGYRFDVMDIGRQVLSNLGQEIHKEAIKSYKEGNEKNFIKHSTRFLGLLKDVDMLLGSRSDFNFNTWLAAAQAQADNEEEKALYTYNASLLVTWWGGDKEPSIFDYSWREWNGLIGDYYYGRWKLFYDMLGQSLKKGVPYEEEGLKMVHGRESLRANAFYNQLADWESVWIKKAKKPVAPTFGKELTYAQNLLSKYDKLFNEYY